MITALETIFWVALRRAENLIAEHGGLRAMIFATETADGRRDVFGAPCQVGQDLVSDGEFLAQLCHELRLDFIDDHVVRFGVVYPARLSHLQTILHEPERLEAIVIEAHDANNNEHLCACRAILGDRLGKLTPLADATPRFASLLQEHGR